MLVNPDDNSVMFKSHNDLYLAINDAFHTCAFKSCRERDNSGFPIKGRWKILQQPDSRVGVIDTRARILVPIAQEIGKAALGEMLGVNI